jgi:hypothetical protein
MKWTREHWVYTERDALTKRKSLLSIFEKQTRAFSIIIILQPGIMVFLIKKIKDKKIINFYIVQHPQAKAIPKIPGHQVIPMQVAHTQMTLLRKKPLGEGSGCFFPRRSFAWTL